MSEGPERPTILVCEDDPLVSPFFMDVFEAAGYRAVSARDGQTALDLAAELRPAVITLDIDLPALDGVTVMHRLKANPTTAHIPVIIVSAHPGWMTFVEEKLATGVIQKPCPPWELQAAVEQALNSAEAS